MVVATREPTQPLAASTQASFKRSWFPWLLAFLCLAVFSALQFHVERNAYTNWSPLPHGGGLHRRVEWATVWYAFALDLARYVGLSIAGFVLAYRGLRRVFALPAITYVVAPVVLGWRDKDCELPGRTLQAIGSGWQGHQLGCASATASNWGPALGHVGLVLLPIVVFALSRRGSKPEPNLGIGSDAAPSIVTDAAGLAFAGFALWALMWGWNTSGKMPDYSLGVQIDALPLIVFGVLLATWRLRWVWSAFAVTLLVAALQLQVPLPGIPFGNFMQGLRSTWPYLALAPIAASWRPISRGLSRLREANVFSVVALNVLNVLDALLTRYAITSEGAVETNPVVRAFGLPLKIILVGLLSVVLYKARPKYLRWLVFVFSSVVVWHLAGFFASSK